MKQTLLALTYSDDFTDGVNDTEQQPDDQGESSDKTADDYVQCKDTDCARYAVTEGEEPETHPSYAKRQADTKPHQEVVAYAVSHVDRLEECCEAKCKSEWNYNLLHEYFDSSH